MPIIALCLSPAGVLAGDWTVTKLRGPVFALDAANNWVPLQRGDVVSDRRQLQTAPNGRVTLTRDGQSIDLEPDTRVQIVDFAGDRKTTVWEHKGTVSVDAEAKDVQHFSVQTPFLAAVVKGTRFTVTADANGSAVDVSRGRVEVQDITNGLSVAVGAGQSASVGENRIVEVNGPGLKEPVVSLNGLPLTAGQQRLIDQQQQTAAAGSTRSVDEAQAVYASQMLGSSRDNSESDGDTSSAPAVSAPDGNGTGADADGDNGQGNNSGGGKPSNPGQGADNSNTPGNTGGDANSNNGQGNNSGGGTPSNPGQGGGTTGSDSDTDTPGEGDGTSQGNPSPGDEAGDDQDKDKGKDDKAEDKAEDNAEDKGEDDGGTGKDKGDEDEGEEDEGEDDEGDDD